MYDKKKNSKKTMNAASGMKELWVLNIKVLFVPLVLFLGTKVHKSVTTQSLTKIQ